MKTLKIKNDQLKKEAELSLKDIILPSLIGLLLLIDPFFVDVQIIRPKLMVIELGLFIVFLVWVIKAVVQGSIVIRKANLNLPITIYVCYIIFSYAISQDRFVAVSELKRVIICSLIYFLAVNSASLNEKIRDLQVKIMLGGFLAGSSIIMLYGLMQHYGNINIFGLMMEAPKLERVYATFGNPIFFAAHLTILLPVLLGVSLYAWNTKRKMVSLIFAGIFVAGLFTLYYTKTRAAWIGIVISLAIFGILNINSKKIKRIFFISFVCVAVIFIIFTWNVWLRHQAHVLIWRDTLHIWLKYPFFGAGPGTFHINFPNFASKELLAIWPQTSSIINDAHNEYVQLLAETGIIGFGIFLWVIFSFFKYGFLKNQSFKTSKQSGQFSYFFTGLVCSAIAILIQNIFSVDMRFLISAFYLFFILGVAYVFEQRSYAFAFNINNGVKTIILVVIFAVTGVIGYEKGNRIHIFSTLHMSLNNAQIQFKPDYTGTGLLPVILRPYLAQKTLAAEVDFFDEKVLEPAKTLDDLRALLNKYPREAKIYEKLGWIYAKEKDFNNAIPSYMKAIELNPGLPGPYNNLGNIFFLLGKREKAIEYYRLAVERFPDKADSRINLGILYYYAGRLKESADQFNEALKIDPTNEKAIVMLKRMRE